MRPFTHQDPTPANDTEKAQSESGAHLDRAQRILSRESEAISLLAKNLPESFQRSVELILSCSGRVFVSGEETMRTLGARVVRALNRSGVASFWLGASEANEGFASLVKKRDLFLLLSESTRSESLLRLLLASRERKIRSICLSLHFNQLLARRCTEFIACTPEPFPDPSSRALPLHENLLQSLAVALADTVTESRNVKFASFDSSIDPGLQHRLGLKVGDLMRSREALRPIAPQTCWNEVLAQTQSSEFGLICVVDEATHVTGLIGSRELLAATLNPAHETLTATTLMSTSPPTVDVHSAVGLAMNMMKVNNLDCLPVTSEDGRLVGALSLRDLLL